MDSIKKQIYRFFDNRLYDTNLPEINKWNRSILVVGLIACMVVYGTLLLFSLFNVIYNPARYVYLALVVFAAGTILISRKLPDKHMPATLFLVHCVVVGLCIYLSGVVWRNNVDVAVVSEMFLVSTLVIDKNMRNNFIIILTTMIYIICIFLLKPYTIASIESINIVCFSLLGIVAGTFTKYALMSNFDNIKQLHISQERYRLATMHSGRIICEYDVAEKCIILTKEMSKMYNLPERVYNTPYEPVRVGIISPETSEDYINFFKQIIDGQETGTVRVKTKTVDRWVWQRANFSTIFDDEGKPISAVISIEDITMQVERERHQRKKAEMDALTGLYNRSTIINKIRKCLEADSEEGYALMLLDLDGLKTINDTLGHPEGDNAIVHMAKIINTHFGEIGYVGRMGGDEFIIYLDHVKSVEEIENIMDYLYLELDKDIVGKHKIYKLTASIGVTFKHSRAYDFNELYEMTDRALYEAKKNGKNRYVIKTHEEKILS